MKILNIIPYSPVPPTFGGALRMFHLLKLMVRYHDVHLISYGTPEEPPRIESMLGIRASNIKMVPAPRWTEDRWKRLGQLYALLRNTSFSMVAWRTTAMQEAIDRCLERESFDIIQLAFPMMGCFSFRSSAVKIMDAANVESDIHRRVAEFSNSRMRRWWSAYEYRKFYPEEIRIYREQDAVMLTSERDRALLDKDVPGVRKFVIPNGVDTSYFTIADGPYEEHSIVFTGAINYFPNSDGIEHFITDVFPLITQQIPDVKLYVVGNAPPESVRRHASESIVVTGFVDDVRPYVARASVYVVPLRIGGGTRLKVLEAMSLRRPIVSTSVGCEGIDVVDGESLLIADEPQQFADATVRLLQDQPLRRSLVEHGYELVRTRYDWPIVGAGLESVYSAVVQAGRGAKSSS